LLNPSSPIYSAVAIRSALAVIYSSQVRAGVPVTALEGLREQLLNVEPYPRELERRLIKARLDDMVHYLGIYDRRVSSVLMGRTTEEVASNIAEQTNVLDTDALDDMLSGFLASGDASLQFGAALATGLTDLQRSTGPIQSRQAEISGEISRARFEVYGTTFPPDATFSLRISDGVVRSYEYNGTLAPAYTTFYGLYDRYHSHGTDTDWDLPTRWANPVPDLDLSTPLNLVTTADIIGGSSGSPLLNTELEIVGLVFDGNIESLPGEFIYTDETARTVAVDSRGIIEALDEMFDADRIVLELLSGELVDSEEEADAVRAGR
jgi:hypothetical protein